jgi:hypothetical protein
MTCGEAIRYLRSWLKKFVTSLLLSTMMLATLPMVPRIPTIVYNIVGN